MTEITPERRKVVLICAAVACMSGGPVLLRNHPAALGAWIALQLLLVVYAVVLFTRLTRRPS